MAKRLIDLDAVWGGEWGRSRYGFIRWVEIVEGVGAASGVDVEHLSYCNQWRLCGVVILCHEEWRCDSSQITLGLSLIHISEPTRPY